MNRACWDLCGGRPAMGVPTAIVRDYTQRVSDAVVRIHPPPPHEKSFANQQLRKPLKAPNVEAGCQFAQILSKRAVV